MRREIIIKEYIRINIFYAYIRSCRKLPEHTARWRSGRFHRILHGTRRRLLALRPWWQQQGLDLDRNPRTRLNCSCPRPRQWTSRWSCQQRRCQTRSSHRRRPYTDHPWRSPAGPRQRNAAPCSRGSSRDASCRASNGRRRIPPGSTGPAPPSNTPRARVAVSGIAVCSERVDQRGYADEVNYGDRLKCLGQEKRE